MRLFEEERDDKGLSMRAIVGSHIESLGENGRGIRLERETASRRIVLVGSDLLGRECLAHALTVYSSDLVVESTAELSETVTVDPSLVLLHLRQERIGDAWWCEQLTEVRVRYGGVPVIVVAHLGDAHTAVEAYRLGLRGYVPTSLGIGICVAAIHLVLAGGIYVPSELVDQLGYAPSSPSDRVDDLRLTSREVDVLDLIQQGKPNKIIAYNLSIAESTVKAHTRSIMRKLRATNRTQLAFMTRE